jgi:hypothetical protein
MSEFLGIKGLVRDSREGESNGLIKDIIEQLQTSA